VERISVFLIGVVSLAVVAVVAALTMDAPGGGRTDVSYLPAVNATLNAIAAVLLVVGFVFVRARRIHAHAIAMLGAVGVSTLFLVSYVTYHYHAGSRAFTGQGWIRPVYFLLLLSHIVLAAVIVPFVLTTLHRAIRADFTRHRRLARLTLPLWLYVSITGVLVYLLLYRLYPG
jgi:uncharacterized membrane protein YozB (DUF420 family)